MVVGLDQIYESIKTELDKVESVIKAQLELVVTDERSRGINDSFIKEVTSHLFQKRGKRLRPALVLLSAKMIGPINNDKNDALAAMAAAVELLHSASLVHDDIIDDADTRRREVTLNKHFDSTVAVLTGDILYAQFFSLLTGLKNVEDKLKLKLFEIFSNLTRNMCLGEIFQHQIVLNLFNPGEKDYLRVLENKTAILMSASCRSGAMINGSDAESAENLASFGLNFGLAYQLLDDFIDKDSPLKEGINLLDRAKQYIEKARGDLAKLPLSGEHLDKLCDFILERAAIH